MTHTTAGRVRNFSIIAMATSSLNVFDEQRVARGRHALRVVGQLRLTLYPSRASNDGLRLLAASR
jgi:hypothetical protein